MLIFLWDTFPYTDASCFPCMVLYYAKVNSGCKAPFFNSRSNSHPEDLTVVIIGCGNVLFTNQMFLSLQHVCPFAFRTHFHTEFPWTQVAALFTRQCVLSVTKRQQWPSLNYMLSCMFVRFICGRKWHGGGAMGVSCPVSSSVEPELVLPVLLVTH